MSTDLALSLLHGHAATWLVPPHRRGTTVTASAGDAGNRAELGFGVIRAHFDEKLCPELEEILTN